VKVTPPATEADADQGSAANADQVQPPAEPKKAAPVQSRPPEKPKVTAPPKKTPSKPAGHWDSLLGALGLQVPKREPEPEPQAEPEPELEMDSPEEMESESAPSPMFAAKSPLDEIFVPREHVEADLRDLFENDAAERSDSSYFEVSESMTVDVEDSIEVTVEDLEDEAGTQPRRRRRRARGRRDSLPVEPVIESRPEPVSELGVEAEAFEESIEEPLMPGLEITDEESIEEPIELGPATEERPPGRKRSRRRRRSKSSGSAERRDKEEDRLPESAPAARGDGPELDEDIAQTDRDDADADDMSGWDSEDEEDRDDQSSRGKKSRSKKITGWIEAVSVLVDANIERHKKGESDRNRGGRSRGRRGR